MRDVTVRALVATMSAVFLIGAVTPVVADSAGGVLDKQFIVLDKDGNPIEEEMDPDGAGSAEDQAGVEDATAEAAPAEGTSGEIISAKDAANEIEGAALADAAETTFNDPGPPGGFGIAELTRLLAPQASAVPTAYVVADFVLPDNLKDGDVLTAWALIFDNPSKCAGDGADGAPRCGPGDLNKQGRPKKGIRLGVYSISGYQTGGDPLPSCPRLQDADTEATDTTCVRLEGEVTKDGGRLLRPKDAKGGVDEAALRGFTDPFGSEIHLFVVRHKFKDAGPTWPEVAGLYNPLKLYKDRKNGKAGGSQDVAKTRGQDQAWLAAFLPVEPPESAGAIGDGEAET